MGLPSGYLLRCGDGVRTGSLNMPNYTVCYWFAIPTSTTGNSRCSESSTSNKDFQTSYASWKQGSEALLVSRPSLRCNPRATLISIFLFRHPRNLVERKVRKAQILSDSLSSIGTIVPIARSHQARTNEHHARLSKANTVGNETSRSGCDCHTNATRHS